MRRATRFEIVAVSAMAIVLALRAGVGQAAIQIHSIDFIADANRSHFNGFESIPTSSLHYTGGSGPYVEDTISVQQINGDSGNSIWTSYSFPGSQGSFDWYPDGGDFGYTQLSLAGPETFKILASTMAAVP